ncbi:MAG: hypothetical protein ACJ71T_02450 [Actinomycetales bacterium]|jgi:hypothetical protein
MTAHQITCTTRSNPRPPAHSHVLSVGLADGRHQTVETVRFRMGQGDTYYTFGAGKFGTVRAYDCYCGVKTIASGLDAVLGNSLDNMPPC